MTPENLCSSGTAGEGQCESSRVSRLLKLQGHLQPPPVFAIIWPSLFYVRYIVVLYDTEIFLIIKIEGPLLIAILHDFF